MADNAADSKPDTCHVYKTVQLCTDEMKNKMKDYCHDKDKFFYFLDRQTDSPPKECRELIYEKLSRCACLTD